VLKEMKAILEFNLPEEQDEHYLAINGAGFYAVCFDLDQQLRAWLKYGHDFAGAEHTLEKCREKLRELFETHGVNLDSVS